VTVLLIDVMKYNRSTLISRVSIRFDVSSFRLEAYNDDDGY